MVSFKNLSKAFGSVQVLKEVSFTIHPGTVTAITGENGAGKSTLMNILSGVITAYDGEILLNDKPIRFHSVRAAEEAGIVMIHQELNIVEGLTIAENMFLGKEPVNRFGFIDFKTLNSESRKWLQQFAVPYEPSAKAESLSIGWRQIIEIIKALKSNSNLIIMDEPTSSLTEHEKELLFKQIRYLTSLGKTIIYISHKMSEVFEIAEHIVVMKDGKFVTQSAVASTSREEVIAAMVGKSLMESSFASDSIHNETILELEHVDVMQNETALLRSLNFSAMRGDVIGVAGLLGAGRTTLLKFLYGALSDVSFGGKLTYHGKAHRPTDIPSALQNRICFLSEDRKLDGILPMLGIKINTTTSIMDKLTTAGFIKKDEERQISIRNLKQLNAKYESLYQDIQRLSGGNQQKVLLSRLLLINPSLLLLDEPTRGIDVGAKEEIYHHIQQLSAAGMTIILSSSEIPEIFKVCNKVLVLSAGQQTLFGNAKELTSSQVLSSAFVHA